MNTTEAAKQIIVTHDGTFHADELFAIATFLDGQARRATEIVRTRDPDLIADADVVIDVGFSFNPRTWRFDHHQPDAPRRPEGENYSSFGLLWRHLGRDYVRRCYRPDNGPVYERDVNAIFEAVDRSFVRSIDRIDNGEQAPGPDSIASLIDHHNPLLPDDDSNALFHHMLFVVRTMLKRLVDRAIVSQLHMRQVEEILSAGTPNAEILVLDRDINWRKAIHEIEAAQNVKFVVGPGKIRPNGEIQEWYVSTVTVEPGTFEDRASLPSSWGAKSGQDLVAATGVATARFCHRKLFLATASERDDAISLAELALQASRA